MPSKRSFEYINGFFCRSLFPQFILDDPEQKLIKKQFSHKVTFILDCWVNYSMFGDQIQVLQLGNFCLWLGSSYKIQLTQELEVNNEKPNSGVRW